jgi:hypothetical protein
VKNLLSIFLALVVLLGNMGLTFSTHYCCGISVKHVLAIGQHGLSCGMAGMDDQQSPRPSAHHTELNKVCCEDQHRTMDVDNAYEAPESPSIPFAAFTWNRTFENPSLRWHLTESPVFESYHPPSSGRHILLLQQVFRL